MRFASLSLDLDNLWSYLKIRGDESWTTYPSYLETVVPRILERLAAQDLRITFFLVGRDLLDDRNLEAVARIAQAGHDFGNHSFNHEPWMHHYDNDRLREEIGDAHDLIRLATGRRCIGFRGPGYTSSPAILETLARLGYAYDCSSLPTWIGPLARTVYFLSGNAKSESPSFPPRRRRCSPRTRTHSAPLRQGTNPSVTRARSFSAPCAADSLP